MYYFFDIFLLFAIYLFTYFFIIFFYLKLDIYIEREYLGYLSQKCGFVVRYKNELEHKLSYYRNSAYRGIIKNELDNLDMQSCRDYYKYKNVRRIFKNLNLKKY